MKIRLSPSQMMGPPGVEYFSAYCLKLDPREGEQRLIHFKRDEDAHGWYQRIFTLQKFHENPLLQYKQIELISEGDFSDVLLQEHVNSKKRFIVKKIDKAKAWETFNSSMCTYQEIELMERVCRSQVPHMLQLVESFKDEKHFYLVVDHHPEGDLFRFLIRVYKEERLPEHLVKQVVR